MSLLQAARSSNHKRVEYENYKLKQAEKSLSYKCVKRSIEKWRRSFHEIHYLS